MAQKHGIYGRCQEAACASRRRDGLFFFEKTTEKGRTSLLKKSSKRLLRRGRGSNRQHTIGSKASSANTCVGTPTKMPPYTNRL
jgi:hypothetical protein